jgi:mono/diheme cytochrome c family protein
MARRYILLCIVGMLAFLTFSAIAQEHANSASSPNVVAPAPAVETGTTTETTHKSGMTTAAPDVAVERALRLEGEKRFRTNCGRCHQPPHKFPPRVMAAAIRHMRVRAMITDEDMRLILKYMTQ